MVTTLCVLVFAGWEKGAEEDKEAEGRQAGFVDTQERARAQDRPGAEGDHEAGGGLRAHLLPPRPGGQSGRIHPGGQGTRLLPQEDGQEEAEVTTEQLSSLFW